MQIILGIIFVLASSISCHPVQDQFHHHEVDKRQVSIVCFGEAVAVDNETECSEQLRAVDSVAECCQPRSVGGEEGAGYSLDEECSLCPVDVPVNVEIRCYSGESCTTNSFITTPDISSCCLSEGERSFTIQRDSESPGQCQRCVVVQWSDFPSTSLRESSAAYTLNIEYSKGADVGFVNSQFRAMPTFITADINDLNVNDPNLNLAGGDASILVAIRPDSNALEIADTFELTIEPVQTPAINEFIGDALEVTIIDGDDVVIELTEEDYRNVEDEGLLAVSVRISPQISSSMFLRIVPLNISYVNSLVNANELVLDENILSQTMMPQDSERPSEADSEDFASTPIVFEVSRSGDRTIEVPITPDDIYEPEQNFVIILELVNSSLSDRVEIGRRAAICRIADDDSIALSWEFPAYTFLEREFEVFIDDVISIIKVENQMTEYLLEFYAQPRSLLNATFSAEWSTPGFDNDFQIGSREIPGVERPLPANSRSDEIGITLFTDNIFNEGAESVELDFSNEADRPGFVFGAFPRTRIVILDRNLTVGFSRETTVVSEGVGEFELCAMIFIPLPQDSLPEFQIANPFTLELFSTNGTAAPALDYVEITSSDNLLVSFETDSSTHVQCFNITIIDDFEFERNEIFSLSLVLEGSPLQSVIVNPSLSVVEIVDNDAVTVGFEVTEYTVNESEGEVTLVVSILDGAVTSPVTLVFSTANGTAISDSDFTITELVFSLSDSDNSINITVPLLIDSLSEENEQFSALLDFVAPQEFSDRVVMAPNVATISILDTSTPVNATRVNDTVIGDPLFTVPLRVTNLQELGLEERLSLCYEVHGAADRYFNLVSDQCTSVNAHYTNISVFNVIDSVAIRAVNELDQCNEILVSLEDMCSASIDGNVVESLYTDNGITIRRYPGSRVRVSVPNCARLSLVMWIYCQSGTLRDYDENDNLLLIPAMMMRFVISRGFNLQERSHGLIGQFWNIPITIELLNFTSEGLPFDDPHYTVTVSHPDSGLRTFVAFYYPRTWEVIRGQNDPCLYAGDHQAGVTDLSDAVIQGTYTDYIVSDAFDSDYQFSRFETRRC